MENILTESFDTWTDYDVWLTKHYETHAIIKLDKIGDKIVAEYVTNEEWTKEQKRLGNL